jgi:hypothetical protein
VTNVPRGKYIGNLVGAQPKDEAEHFIKCSACDGSTAAILASVRTEGPLPHPAQDRPQ